GGHVGVVGHRHPYKIVHAVGSASTRGQNDLLIRQTNVLLIHPKAVIATHHSVDVENSRVNEAADAEDAAELAFGEAVFEAVHWVKKSEVRGQKSAKVQSRTWYT